MILLQNVTINRPRSWRVELYDDPVGPDRFHVQVWFRQDLVLGKSFSDIRQADAYAYYVDRVRLNTFYAERSITYSSSLRPSRDEVRVINEQYCAADCEPVATGSRRPFPRAYEPALDHYSEEDLPDL